MAGICVVLALVALWVWTPATLAAGGGIEVIEDHGEVDFPTELSFTLTAESDNDIVAVQLLYRPVGSDTWSYAYPDFTPGRQVTTILELRITGSAYLPPGTQVEYYYVITDAQGNSLRTDTNVLEYIDHRFSWDQTQVDSLVLLHHDLSESRVESVSKEVEEALTHIRSLLLIETARPMRGVIYNSNAEARNALPRQSQTITDAQVFGGFAFPPSGIFVAIGFRTGIISHEAAHLLFRQALGPKALPVPAWLDEGFAGYVEPGSTPFSGQSMSSRGLSLRAMSRVSGTPRDIGTFYQKAESVVAYMIEEFGVASFQRLVSNLAEGRTIDQALVAAYGVDTNGLEARWATEDRGPAAPAPGSRSRGSPWASFSTLVLGALAIVVSIAVVFRYVLNKLRPAHAPEEGLQPWEDPDRFDPDDYEPR